MNMTISFARYRKGEYDNFICQIKEDHHQYGLWKITINMEESSIVSSDASISLVSPVVPGVTKLGC